MESHISPFIYESPVRLSCICNTQPHTLTPHTYTSHIPLKIKQKLYVIGYWMVVRSHLVI